MKRVKVITLCASVSHYPQLIEIQKDLRKLNFQVKIPSSIRSMKRKNNFDVAAQKTWYQNPGDYSKKTKLMTDHFKKVQEADAILVVNFEKNGIPGYIGGNVLMEMLVAFLNKKTIYILNPISESLSIKEEIYGLKPRFISGDLAKIE